MDIFKYGYCAMKNKFTDEQIAFALKQAEDGTLVAEGISKMWITEQSYYHWKKKYGVFGMNELRTREIATFRVRYGYKRVHVPIKCEGWEIITTAIKHLNPGFLRRRESIEYDRFRIA